MIKLDPDILVVDHRKPVVGGADFTALIVKAGYTGYSRYELDKYEICSFDLSKYSIVLSIARTKVGDKYTWYTSSDKYVPVAAGHSIGIGVALHIRPVPQNIWWHCAHERGQHEAFCACLLELS